MSEKIIEAVCIWPDTAGQKNDDGSARWIVSRDRLNDRGEAEATRTIDVCDSRAEALASARKSAAALGGLPLFENGENAAAVEIE